MRGGSLGLVSTAFVRKKYLFQIKWNKMISKYKTIHILLTNVHLDCRGKVSSNRNASRDESVETTDESVEAGDKSIEAGEKTQQSCYNSHHGIDNKIQINNVVACFTKCYDMPCNYLHFELWNSKHIQVIMCTVLIFLICRSWWSKIYLCVGKHFERLYNKSFLFAE